MARLSHARGATLVGYSELAPNLALALERLGLAKCFDKNARNEVVEILSVIMGRWSQERDRVEARFVTAKLRTIARNLSDASKLLDAGAGWRRTEDIETLTRLSTALARRPEIKMAPRDYLNDFNRRCQIVISAAQAQAKETASTEGHRGRPQLEWYDNFTDLLVQMAKRCGIKPTISTDRETGKKGGPFVELARALEGLLVKQMRSQSKTASIKRLERSLRRNRPRQKSAEA